MTLILFESADGVPTGGQGSASTLIGGKWTAQTSMGIMAGGSTWGGDGNIIGWSGPGPTARLRYALLAAEQDDWLAVGARAKVNAFDDNRTLLELFGDSGATLHVALRVNTVGRLQVLRGGTVIASTPVGTIKLNVIHYIELAVRLADSTSDLVVYVDDTLQTLDVAGPYDTKNGGTGAVFDEVNLVSQSNVNGRWDFRDVYILNEQGAGPNNVRLGPCRSVAIFPDGNGNSSQFVGSDADSVDNYLLVDELDQDEDTTYVESGTDDNKDTYSFETVTGVGTVAGIQIVARARRTDTDGRDIALVQRLSTAVPAEQDSADQALAASYALHRSLHETDPGASAWTIANINAGEFGQKSRPT